jgi:hypothetical protein
LKAGAEGSFEIVATPATKAEGPVRAHVSLHGPHAGPWTGTVEVSAQGAVRISGPAAVLRGAEELRLVVGPSSQRQRVYRCAIDQ